MASLTSARSHRQCSGVACVVVRAGIIFCLLWLFSSSSANAVSAVWNLSGIAFDDGGVATGSFSYDPATGLYSNVNITTAAGILTGATYKFVCGQDVPSCTGLAPNSSEVLLLTSTAADQTGLPALALFFSPSMQLSGIAQVDGLEAGCGDSFCSTPNDSVRVITEGVAMAQATFTMKHAVHLQAGESYIHIINDGSNGVPAVTRRQILPAGNLCANVYALDINGNMISCCSCLVSPEQTVNLGVNQHILSNRTTGAAPDSLALKLVATLAGGDGTGTSCTNSASGVATTALAAGMEAFGTTLQAQDNTFVTTEGPFAPATLSAGELTSLANECNAIMGSTGAFSSCSNCGQDPPAAAARM